MFLKLSWKTVLVFENITYMSFYIRQQEQDFQRFFSKSLCFPKNKKSFHKECLEELRDADWSKPTSFLKVYSAENISLTNNFLHFGLVQFLCNIFTHQLFHLPLKTFAWVTFKATVIRALWCNGMCYGVYAKMPTDVGSRFILRPNWITTQWTHRFYYLSGIINATWKYCF